MFFHCLLNGTSPTISRYFVVTHKYVICDIGMNDLGGEEVSIKLMNIRCS